MEKNVCGPADSSPWDAAQIPSKHLIPPPIPPTLPFPYANLPPKTLIHPQNIQGRAEKRCAALPSLISFLTVCCSSKLRNRSRPPVHYTFTVRPPLLLPPTPYTHLPSETSIRTSIHSPTKFRRTGSKVSRAADSSPMRYRLDVES